MQLQYYLLYSRAVQFSEGRIMIKPPLLCPGIGAIADHHIIHTLLVCPVKALVGGFVDDLPMLYGIKRIY